MRNSHGGRESCRVGLINCIRKSNTLVFMSSSKDDCRFSRKTQRQSSIHFLVNHFFQYHAYENCTDLNLCEGLRIFFFFCFPDTGLYLLNGFDLLEFFLFLMAWQWKPAISVAQTATRGSFFRMLFTNSFCRCCYAHDMCYRKLQQKEACGKSYHIVQLYLTTYLRKGCSGCGKYAPWSNCNKAVK